MKIDVVVCTKNTPLAFECTIRSLLHYNKDIEPLFHVVNNGQDIGTKAFLKKMPIVQLIDVPENQQHGELISMLVKNCKEDFFLTLDSDIEFTDHGVISNLLERMDSETFAIGEYEFDQTETYRPPSVPEINKYHVFGKFRDENYNQKRICPWLAIWRHDDCLKKVMERFSFGWAMQSGVVKGRAWDTASLITTVMELMGRKAIDYKDPRYIHHGSLTWRPRLYFEKTAYFQERIRRLSEY